MKNPAGQSLPKMALPNIASLPVSVNPRETQETSPDHRLAVLYHTRKNYEQAENLYQKALKAMEKTGGRKKTEFGQLLNNLGRLHHDQERYAEAETLYKRSLAIVEQHYGEFSPKVAKRLANLAELYFSRGMNDEVIVNYQRAGTILEREFGPEHPTTEKNLKAYAGMLRTMNRTADAEAIEDRLQISRMERDRRIRENRRVREAGSELHGKSIAERRLQSRRAQQDSSQCAM